MKRLLFIILFSPVFFACKNTVAPVPYGPVPSSRQLSWQHMEFYAFVHFNMNTFTNKEWGYGDESPSLFHAPEKSGE